MPYRPINATATTISQLGCFCACCWKSTGLRKRNSGTWTLQPCMRCVWPGSLSPTHHPRHDRLLSQEGDHELITAYSLIQTHAHPRWVTAAEETICSKNTSTDTGRKTKKQINKVLRPPRLYLVPPATAGVFPSCETSFRGYLTLLFKNHFSTLWAEPLLLWGRRWSPAALQQRSYFTAHLLKNSVGAAAISSAKRALAGFTNMKNGRLYRCKTGEWGN